MVSTDNIKQRKEETKTITMKLTKKQKKLIIEGHGAACSEWKVKIAEGFPKLFKSEKFEAGDWIVDDTAGNVTIERISKIEGGMFFTSADGVPGETRYTSDANFRKATSKEIEGHLLSEAKRKGFTGVITFYAVRGRRGIYRDESLSELRYNEWDDSLCTRGNGNGTIYHKGEWANPIIKLTKKEAEEKLNCTIID